MQRFDQTNRYRKDSNLQDSSISPEFLEYDDSEFLEDDDYGSLMEWALCRLCL